MPSLPQALRSSRSLLDRARVALLTSVVIALPVSLLSCRYDPVPQEIIDDLGPETGKADSKHRPGQPCLACHSAYAGAAPIMAFGGTVYTTDADGKTLVPAAGVEITVTDWSGVPKKRCSNAAGNFFLEKTNWKDAAFPLFVTAGNHKMESLIGRDGSCASCHKLPPQDADVHDPVSGANFDSSGAILVDAADLDQCQGAP